MRPRFSKAACRDVLALVAVLLLLLALLAAKGLLIALPEPPASSTTLQFDAERAAARLARILGDERPHPVDSAASDMVRGRLAAEMRAVGLEPRMTDDFVCNSFATSRAIACARVRNLVASIGPSEGRHLLLSAHYDSTFAGPGAGDAGIGIASLLETAHLLRGQRLARPVTFLFNEGEEMGLLGARAFLGRDAVASRVDTLVNLEARGVAGPAVMFETSRPNAAALAAFAAVGRPVANSLTTDLYGLIPNSTDVAVFGDQRWTILNLAIIGNETRYHSAGDNLAALDRGSLQHMGEQTLSLARALGSGRSTAATGERLYMDLLGSRLVTVPLLPGLGLLGFLLIVFAIVAWRRRALGRLGLAMFAATLGSAALAWLGLFLVGLLRSGDFWRGHPLVTTTAVYASALAAALVFLLWLAGHAGRSRLRAAYWLFFLTTGAVLSAVAPGAAIFFLFPPLLFLAGLIASRWLPAAEAVGAVAAAILVFLTLGPALAMFEELMSSGPHYLFAPLGLLVILPLLIELLPIARRAEPAFAYGTAGALFLVAWLAVLLAPAYSEDRKQLFAVEYVRDADGGRWAVNNDGSPVPFAGRWDFEKVPWSGRRRWLSPAPALPIAAPTIELLAQEPAGEGRRLSLRLRTNGAESVSLIAPPDAGLIEAGSGAFSGRFAAEAGPEARYFLRCIGRSCDGAVFELVAENENPIDLTVVGTRPGLPPAAAPLVAARPRLAQPQYSPDSTLTLGRARF